MNGVAEPTNEWAAHRMEINLPLKHQDKGPKHGDHYLKLLAKEHRRSSAYGVKLS